MPTTHLARVSQDSGMWDHKGLRGEDLAPGVADTDAVNLAQLLEYQFGKPQTVTGAHTAAQGEHLMLNGAVPLTATLPDDTSGEPFYFVRAEYIPGTFPAASMLDGASVGTQFYTGGSATFSPLGGTFFRLRYDAPVAFYRLAGSTAWQVVGPDYLIRDPTWQTPTLSAGFTAVQPPKYRINANGRVMLRGLLSVTAPDSSAWQTLMNLPIGYRPFGGLRQYCLPTHDDPGPQNSERILNPVLAEVDGAGVVKVGRNTMSNVLIIGLYPIEFETQ